MGGGKEEGENGELERERGGGGGRGGGSQSQIHAQFHFAQLPTLYYIYLFFSLSSHPLLLSSLLPLHLHHTHTHYISLQWTVASSALKILLKLVDQHELSSEDLIEQNYEILQGAAGGGVVGGVGGGHATQFIKLPKPPGFNILLHLLNDTPLLRKVRMHIIDCT